MSDEIDVEELLRRGGKRQEAPSGGASFASGLAQGATANLGDEMEGIQTAANFGALAGGKALLTGDWDTLKKTPEAVLQLYRAKRDARRQQNQVDEAANPRTFTTGNVAGAVGTGIATGPVGVGLRGTMAMGALEGAMGGAGANEDDLTGGDVRNYAQAFGDALKGSAWGAGAGVAGYGIGAGARWVGQKAKGMLGRARGELLEEAGAARAVEDEALQRADIEQQRKMAVDQESALKMDKARAREAAREKMAAERAARAQSGGALRTPFDASADPDTNVLDGYAQGARKLRKDNAREVLDARSRLERQDITAEERVELEGYLRGHGDAVDKPVAFRLRSIESNLRKKGYSEDVVQRAMARFDAQGNAVSRGRAQQPTQQGDLPPPSAPKPSGLELPERTQLQNADDWARRGDFARAGGGGSALDGLQEAGTRVDARMQPDPFHDANTRVGLMPVQPTGKSKWEFEFRDPKSGRDYIVKLSPNPDDGQAIQLDIIRPKDMSTPQALTSGYDAAKNTAGPGVIKQIYSELARAFPEAKRITAYRASGWAEGRDMALRLPEVTRPNAMPMPASQRQLRSDKGHGPYRDWPETEPTFNDAWPAGAGDDLDEATSIPTPRDWLKRGHDPMGVVRQGGGGSAWDARQQAAAEDAVPEVDELASPGRPLFPSEAGVRPRPLGPLPRGINPYEAEQTPAATVGGRGRPAPAGEGTRNVRGQGARAPAVDEALAVRRAAAAEAQLGGGAPSRPEATRPGRGRPSPAYDPDNSMVAPRDFADLPPEPELPVTRTAPLEGDPTVIRRRLGAAEPEPTVAAEVPRIRRTMGPQEPVREVRRDGATRFGPPPLEQRMAARPSVEEMARQREQGAIGKLGMAGYEGARGANNMLAAPVGAAIGITREALQNPAVRARAISAFKLDRLARVRPEVFGRVGRILAKAMQKGPKRYDATRHVLLLNDAEFRQAEMEAEEELQGLDDEALSQKLRGAR